MKKKKGLFFGALVFALAAFLYFMPLKLADLAGEEQYILLQYQELGVENGSPYIDSTKYNDITEDEKRRIIEVLKRYSCRRTWKTVFSDGSLTELGNEAVNIYIYDENSELAHTVFVTDSGDISMNGKVYAMKSAPAFIDELLEIVDRDGTENADDADMESDVDDVESPGILPVEELPETDLNRNGIPEKLCFVEAYDGEGQRLEALEGGEKIWSESGSYYAYGWQNAVFLCRQNGEDYLLDYDPAMYQGCGDYYYSLFTMEDDRPTTVQWNDVSFDLDFGSPIHRDFDAEAIAAFLEEVNGLLADSTLLINRNSELQETFEKEGAFRDTLWWLDDEAFGFVRDQSKSVAENLRDFEEMMSGRKRQDSATDCDALPFEEGMEMVFSSGVGAWRTYLTLYPDGSFAGEYTDSDAGDTGEDYPNGTQYICQFHGSFGEIKQMSDTFYSLVLKELVTDTGHPEGEEWIEEGVRYVSSAPYGLDGEDGETLKPGAVFWFYTPEATGYEPGSSLYGAAEFCSWMPERRRLVNETDTLGYYGLHNLETNYGFFSTGVMETDLSGYFDGLKGAAVLYNAGRDEYIIYNKELAKKRTSPCSTFKIISSCIALESGIIVPEHSVRTWSGETFWNEKWNQDMDFETAFRESCVWYFREVIDEIGPERMQKELKGLLYGNFDISDWEGKLNTNNSNPALTGFWIESSLKISPKEQTEVLECIFRENSSYSPETQKELKKVMLALEDEQTGIAVYGKTGMGKSKGVVVDAWYTGFAEKGGERVYFCVYLGENAGQDFSSQRAKEIALKLIEDYF